MASYAAEKEMRIFVEKIEGSRHTLVGDAHRHVAYAQRSRVGDEITLCPGDGNDYFGVIESISSDKTTVKINSKSPSYGEPNVKVTLMCCVPNKGEKLDLIVQKATELGVSEVCPIISEFTQAKAQSVRLDRLSRISEEAAKQCGRGIIPIIREPKKFESAVENLSNFDLVVFPYEREKDLPLKTFLREHADDVGSVAVIIGSEGGFSEKEAERLSEKGVKSVTLGRRILRAETANIAVLAVLMYELGEWQCGGDK